MSHGVTALLSSGAARRTLSQLRQGEDLAIISKALQLPLE